MNLDAIISLADYKIDTIPSNSPPPDDQAFAAMRGNPYAWADIRLTASYAGVTATAVIHNQSHPSRQAFTASGAYTKAARLAAARLMTKLQTVATAVSQLEVTE